APSTAAAMCPPTPPCRGRIERQVTRTDPRTNGRRNGSTISETAVTSSGRFRRRRPWYDETDGDRGAPPGSLCPRLAHRVRRGEDQGAAGGGDRGRDGRAARRRPGWRLLGLR